MLLFGGTYPKRAFINILYLALNDGVFIKMMLLKIFLIIYSVSAFSQEEFQMKHKTVEFVFNIPISTPINEPIYLTGDFPGYCYWRADCLRLEHLGDRSYGIKILLPEAIKALEFKVTRGSFTKEAANPLGKALPNFFLPLSQEYTFFRHNIVNWTDLKPLGVTGDLRMHTKFYSPELKNHRTVSVWLPENYEQNPQKRYPVIYAHDGQNMFDPTRSYLGVDWGIDETLTDLAAKGVISEAIVVGIDCTFDREAEYYFKHKGPLYAEFLRNTLKPFIDTNYRTLGDRDNTYTMGSSMGALVSTYLLWTNADLFSKAVAPAFPPSIFDNEFLTLLEDYPKPNYPIKLYIDHGMQDMDVDFKDASEKFYAKMIELGYKANDEIVYRVFHYSGHNESDWANRADTFLEFLLKK